MLVVTVVVLVPPVEAAGGALEVVATEVLVRRDTGGVGKVGVPGGDLPSHVKSQLNCSDREQLKALVCFNAENCQYVKLSILKLNNNELKIISTNFMTWLSMETNECLHNSVLKYYSEYQ